MLIVRGGQYRLSLMPIVRGGQYRLSVMLIVRGVDTGYQSC